MQIRTANHKDVEGIHAVESVSFSVPWSMESFRSEIDNVITCYLVAEEEGEILGFVGMWEVMGEGQITNVAVHTKARKRGIGQQLIKDLITYAKEKELEVLLLEVREGNEAAQRLYESVGFKVVGKRKNYYTKPMEDAFIMALSLVV